MKDYDFLIVGSGLFGAMFAWKAHQNGKKCLVVDKRPHTGGNVYCEQVEGINVHKYGPHIFHTSNKLVWDFVNGIVPFNRYTNCPLACYKGKFYNLPFNMNTFYQMWGVKTPEEAEKILSEQRHAALEKMAKDGVNEPRNLEEQALLLVGYDIYERLIKGYTEKQWGRQCRDLPAFIIKRLPVRMVYDNNYFNDRYQGVPIGGYNILIDSLLEGVDVLLNTDFFTRRPYWESIAETIVFTGQIDEFFNYCYGKLNYRTVRFEQEVFNVPNYQGNAVINYTEAKVPYTRVIEHKHFEMFGQELYDCPRTVIFKEYSVEWGDGMEPYYPVNDKDNALLADKYRQLAKDQKHVIFGGRLAEYRYYDMAPIIEKVLNMSI